MKIKDLLVNSKISDSRLNEVINCHPKQIVSNDILIPVWCIKYSYLTQRGNKKEANKYVFRSESCWDSIVHEFDSYIKSFNEENPDRKVLNVEILDTEYLGELNLNLE